MPPPSSIPFCHRIGHLILFPPTFRGGLGVTDGFLSRNDGYGPLKSCFSPPRSAVPISYLSLTISEILGICRPKIKAHHRRRRRRRNHDGGTPISDTISLIPKVVVRPTWQHIFDLRSPFLL